MTKDVILQKMLNIHHFWGEFWLFILRCVIYCIWKVIEEVHSLQYGLMLVRQPRIMSIIRVVPQHCTEGWTCNLRVWRRVLLDYWVNVQFGFGLFIQTTTFYSMYLSHHQHTHRNVDSTNFTLHTSSSILTNTQSNISHSLILT